VRMGWPLTPLGEVLVQNTEYVDNLEPIEYPKLSVKLYGRGVELDGTADGASVKMNRHQLAKPGQVIVSEIWAKKGAIGVVPAEGAGALCTSHFFLFDVHERRVHRGWLKALFWANYLGSRFDEQAKGTTTYAAIRPKQFLAAEIPLPPLEEQWRIVAKLERLATNIDEAKGLHERNEESVRAALISEFRRLTLGARGRPMSEVAPLVRRSVAIEMEATYPEVGIRSFGRGTFQKPELSGFEVGSKKLFEIHSGDLLFNIVFAWEGAVAVARPEDHGRFGSHRFLTCVPTRNVATAEFLRFYFLTDEGLSKLGKASPGGAGRNRTLGLKALEQIEVPVPPIEQQLWFEASRPRSTA
jgi:type I restriction enzyme, S subunit